MANTFRRLGINLLATAGTDIRTKASANDTTSGFLNEKLSAPVSGKLTKSIVNPSGNETVAYDVNEAAIDHDALLNFEADEHRLQDDTQTTNSTLWSSQKTQDELDLKVNKIDPVADNRLLKSVGTTGVDMEQTAITVDDSGNVSGIQDLIVSGDLTVNGTTTSVNSDTLDVVDANITVNIGGTEASADLADAGITVEMSDATNAVIGFDSALTSKFKLGEDGDLREVLTTTHTQALSNKTINADINTLSNIELDNLKASAIDLDDTLSTADDTKIPTSLTVKNYVDTAVATKDQASEISVVPTADLLSTDVQAALEELQGEILTDTQALADHIADATDAHAASSITNTPAGDIIATDVQSAINELDTEKLNISAFGTEFDSALALKDTGDLAEGSNLYFTNTRARDAAVVDSMVGNQSNQAPSVDAVKTFIGNSAPAGSLAKADGDIDLTSFTGVAGATSAAVTGFSFNELVVRSFKGQISVSRTATSPLFEVFEILGLNLGGAWEITYSSLGDSSGITFDIDNDGQLRYSSTSPAGHTATVMSFRALVTHI